MEKIFAPNYKNSIITLSATLLDYAGVKNKYPKNKLIKAALSKGYNNVVFMLFDGLGEANLRQCLNNCDYLCLNDRGIMNSVFPPTTTAATTTYFTCKYPAEHGWLGWNMYFPQIDKVIDLFSGKESFTQTVVDPNWAKDTLGYDSIYTRIENKGKMDIYSLYPSTIDTPCKNSIKYIDTIDQFKRLRTLLQTKGKKIIITYNKDPDGLMHEFGTKSRQVKSFVKAINRKVEKLAEEVDDTLFIISADHGQIEVANRIYLHQYQDVCDLLAAPPSIDSRAVSFWVKEGKRLQFYKTFMRHFGNEFVLLTKETVLKKKLFGPGRSYYLDKYLGDFIAIGIGNSIIQYTNVDDRDLFVFRGHHSGLTRAEVEVPLIMIERPKDNKKGK